MPHAGAGNDATNVRARWLPLARALARSGPEIELCRVYQRPHARGGGRLILLQPCPRPCAVRLARLATRYFIIQPTYP